MNRIKNSQGSKYLVVLLVLLAILIGPRAALASTRIDNDGQLPYYARLAANEIYTDGEWVGIVFYRQPDCIPAEFNLLDFFDFANCWGCAPTTDGFEIWKTAPGVDLAPYQQVLRGLGAVPVWFVSLEEMNSAIADETLTIGELADLSSLLKGTADFYHETLHPYGGAVVNTMLIESHGSLENGTPFKFHAGHTEHSLNVMIVLGE